MTTYDEDEWDQDNVTLMRKALSAAQSLLAAACGWLADPNGRPGAVGEKAIRRICEYAGKSFAGIINVRVKMGAEIFRSENLTLF